MNQIIQSRKFERETRRKMIFYLEIEEERLKKLREEEEARQRQGSFVFSNKAILVLCDLMEHYNFGTLVSELYYLSINDFCAAIYYHERGNVRVQYLLRLYTHSFIGISIISMFSTNNVQTLIQPNTTQEHWEFWMRKIY